MRRVTFSVGTAVSDVSHSLYVKQRTACYSKGGAEGTHPIYTGEEEVQELFKFPSVCYWLDKPLYVYTRR